MVSTKNNKNNLIYDDYRYNCYSIFYKDSRIKEEYMYSQKLFLYEMISVPSLFFSKILENNECFVLHFSTCMFNKNKYWTPWCPLNNKYGFCRIY